MPLSGDDWAAIRLTLELATLTTALLLVLGTPIAWWLSRTDSWLKGRWARWWRCRWCCRPRSSASTCW